MFFQRFQILAFLFQTSKRENNNNNENNITDRPNNIMLAHVIVVHYINQQAFLKICKTNGTFTSGFGGQTKGLCETQPKMLYIFK